MQATESILKQMYQAILAKDVLAQEKLKKEMIEHNLLVHKNNQKITPSDTIFVG